MANRHPGQTSKLSSILRRAGTAFILAGVLLYDGPLQANVLTWTGGGTTSYWSDSGNWGGVGTPTFGDTVVFVGGAPRFFNTNNFAGLVLNRVCFTGASGGFNIYGNALSVTNAIQTTNVTGVNTIFPDLTLATTNVTVNVSNAATLILDGNVQGTVGLVKTGAGTLEFSGPPANTYSGTTWVNTGTLILNRNGFFNSFAGPLVISDGSATAVVQSAQSDELPGTAITINQGGTLNLNGFNDNAGTLVTLNGNGSISTGTGTLSLPSNATVYANPGFIEVDSISGNLNVGAGPCTFAVSFDVGSLIIGAQVSGSGIINVTSNGFMSLNASNIFTGQLNVQNAAMVTINNSYALGATNSAVTVSNSAQLNVPDAMYVQGKTLIDASGNTNGSLNLVGAGADSDWVGPITLATQTTVNVASNGYFYFAGVVSGPGGITEIGQGALLFNSPGNTYTGQTTVSSNTLLVLGTGNVGSMGDLDVAGEVYCVESYQLWVTCNLKIEQGGLFSVGAQYEACNTLSGSGTVDLGSSGVGMAVGYAGGGTCEFDGLITNTGSLAVNDTSLTLTRNNTYTGETDVYNGAKLIVNGYQPNSPVQLSDGGSLYGTGTVGPIYCTNANLGPGYSAGTLSCGTVVLTNNSVYVAFLLGSQPGTGYGQLYPYAATSINIEGAYLAVITDFHADDAPTNGQKYVIINNQTAHPIIGEFAGFPEGAIYTAQNGMQFIVTYDQQVVLTYTNAPSEQVNPAFSAGNGSGFLEPDECSDLNVTLVNPGTNVLQGVTAVLRSLTPGVAVTQPFSPYPNTIVAGGQAMNLAPFQIQTQPWLSCPTNVNFQISYNSTTAGAFSVPFTMQLGAPLEFDNFVSTPIPDNGEIISDVAVSGMTAPISKVEVSMYLTHTYDSDLVVDLVAPDNTTVHLLNKDGHNGQNFGSACGAGTETVFDDFGTVNISNGVAPFVGVFQPVSPLSALIGKTPAAVNNLKWNLNLSDTEPGNTGILQCWSLRIWPGACTDGGGLCELCPNTTIYSALGTNSPLLDRLSRTGVPSTCAQPTSFPDYEFESDYYDAYTFRNGPSDACIDVTLTAPTADLFSSSFLNTFNPTNSAATYLGDSGSATLDGIGTTAVNYSFHVAANAVFIVTVNGIGGDFGPYALQVTGGSCQPVLNITPAGSNNVAVSWSTAAGGYLLESTNRLGQPAAAWQTVNPPPVVVGTNYVVTNSATGADQFYRLRKPQP